jgi:serine/threonine-protein kinase
MGDVYLARQASLDRLVAIKLLPPDLARDKAYVQHFLKEARSAAKVSHENIMGAYDCGEANGRYFFVMEYVAGETLFKQIHKKGFLGEARALDITRMVARGLRHAHQLGLIHRDIKPKNILITAEGTAKLCDFGLAREVRAAENQAEEEFLHTTPAYASPEQCRGEAKLDHRTDLYSLGITLFEMLTGKRPFQAATSKELMTKQVTEAPPAPRSLNPSISEATNQLVLRMLRKQPSERFKDYDELLVAIDGIAGSRQDPVTRRRRTLLLAGSAAVGLVAIVLAIVLATGGHKPPPPDPAAAAPKAPAIDAKMQKMMDEAAAFQARAKEADTLAARILSEADSAERGGRPVDALGALRRFPADLARTEAGGRVAARALEIERGMDQRFRDGMQGVGAAVAAGKLEEAGAKLTALRTTLALDSASGEIRPEYEQQMDAMRSRIAEESALAQKKAEAAKPQPAPLPALPAPAAPEAKAPDAKLPPAADPSKGARPPKGRRPPNPSAAAPMSILAQPEERIDPAKRSEAATFFTVNAPKCAFYRAAAVFLSRAEQDWNVEGPVKAALDEYFATPDLALAESLTPDQEAEILSSLAKKMATLGSARVEALQMFVCAHLDDLLARKGKPDPQILTQAGLAKAPASDLWGPPASIARIEMAKFLVHPPGLWLTRAVELSSIAPDFPSRLLGSLCLIKDATFDAAQAVDRWKRVGAGAPDATWTKFCEAVAAGLKLSMTCEFCGGQGKYPCTACNSQGAVACPTCKGVGKAVDPAEGGLVTCPSCKGRRGAPCPLCSGQKSLKCAVCDGKKARTTLSGGNYRWLIDLGLCDSCEGEGSLFKASGWPCPACDGSGRLWESFLKEYSKLPAWIRTREGRGLYNSLRWLARHQAPEGFWGPTEWTAACREPGCTAFPSSGLDVGMTSLGLATFLSAGLGPESDLQVGRVSVGSVIRKAIAWLLSQQQPDGSIVHGSTVKPVYENLLAVYALFTAVASITPSEAFSDKDKAALKDGALRALKAALAVQNKGAGWGYTPMAPSDSWSTSWGAAALLAAREAGVEIPRINLQWIITWYDSTTDKKDFHLGYAPAQMAKVNLAGHEMYLHHDTLSAFGGMMRAQIEGKPSATVAIADKLVTFDLANPDPFRRDFCYWYLATSFLVQREKRTGSGWTAWSQAVLRESLTLQQTIDTCTLGSWLPDERWSPMGGKPYATAMNALLLEQVMGLVPTRAAKAK